MQANLVTLTDKQAAKFISAVTSSLYEAQKDYRRCDDEDSEACRKAVDAAEDSVYEAVKQLRAGRTIEVHPDFLAWLNEEHFGDEYIPSFEKGMEHAEEIVHGLLNPRWGASRFQPL